MSEDDDHGHSTLESNEYPEQLRTACHDVAIGDCRINGSVKNRCDKDASLAMIEDPCHLYGRGNRRQH
ncbi:MAG: hypothetical protein KDH90_05320, partial [Anaerolineae bacterium]|nr:hypothetical protein [Anaerolineae bacterium]